MTFTIYGGEQADLDSASREAARLDRLFSVTNEQSEIYALNHAQGQWVEVSREVFRLLEQALALCESTGGALDITAYPAVRAWGFTTGEYRVVDAAEREELAARIDYRAVELDAARCAVRLPAGMELDLGAVVKGYAGEVLADALRESGVRSANLYLGGNVQMVGRKPGSKLWRVGVQDPESQNYLGVLEVEDQAVVTSGGYQRYFQQGGETYWHIMDPAAAAPARSGVISATVVGDSGAVCDALSTALFVLGAEASAEYWRAHPEFDFLLVLDSGEIWLTQGVEERFSLAQGYENREVTVVRYE